MHSTRLPLTLRNRPFSTADAVAGGVPRQRLRRGDLAAPFHGVRMPADWDPTLLARCRAYATRMPAQHAFTGPTAAQLWGLPLPMSMHEDPVLHVVDLGGRRAPRGRLVAGYRTSRSLESVTLHGVRVLSAAETWASLATTLTLDDLVAAGDRLLGLPVALATPAEIEEVVGDLGTLRGARRLREAAALIRPNVYSARETRTRLLITRANLGGSEPEPNGAIELHHGGVIRGDLVFRRERVVVEYEGEHHLTDPIQWARDLERYNDLALSGWLVIRLSRKMHDDQIVARVAAAFRSPR
jgi:hypothetical protein